MYAKTRKQRAAYEQRASIADIILRDGTMVNRAKVPFHVAKKTEFKFNNLDRFLSVEIEIAGLTKTQKNPLQLDLKTVEINSVVGKWRGQIVEDVSLPQQGFEINTAPANGDLFVQQINDICGVLSKFGASAENKWDPRKRVQCCGLHVHVDARDFHYADLRRFLILYELIESDIYRMLPGYRRASHFCHPCGARYGMMVRANKPIPPEQKKKSPDPLKVSVISSVYGNDVTMPNRGDKRACPQDTRYSSVNLHQYFYRGTIEFRHFYGTVDPELIIPWARLVGGILEYSAITADTKVSGFQISDSILLTIARRYGLENFVTSQWDRYKNDNNEKESPLLGNAPEMIVQNAGHIIADALRDF